MPAKPTKITVAWDDGTSTDWVPAANVPATPLPTPVPPPPTPTPVPPAPTPTPVPPTVTTLIIAKGQPGRFIDGNGRDVRQPAMWLRADQRDPTAPGWNANTADGRGPDLLTIRNAASVTIEDVTLERGGQNLVLQNISGDVTLRRLRSFDSWSLNQAAMYQGQGVFADGVRGTLTIDACVFDRNGWQPGIPPHNRDTFGHSLYHQRGCGPARITATAAMRASNAGFMLRSAGMVEGSLVADCGTGIIAMGRGDTVDVADTVILAGHHYWDGSNWTGLTALMSYAKLLRLTNVLIVYVPTVYPPPAAGERSFDAGCIVLSNSYPAPHQDWADPHPAIECHNVTVCGAWPGELVTLNNKPLANVPGLTVRPALAGIDVSALIQQVRTGGLSVADAIGIAKAKALAAA